MHVILLQSTFQISYTQLLMIPALLIGGFFGWQRGWKEEAITTVGIIFAIVLFSNQTVASSVAELLNRIVSAFGVFINALFGNDGNGSEPFITNDNFDTFRVIAFIIGVILAYIIGTALGRRSGVNRGGQVIGTGLGMLNAYIVLSRALDFWIARERDNLNLPFEDGAQILVSPMTQENTLRPHLPTIFALLFLVVLVVTFFRLPKMRQ